jgi:hypothetical protein
MFEGGLHGSTPATLSQNTAPRHNFQLADNLFWMDAASTTSVLFWAEIGWTSRSRNRRSDFYTLKVSLMVFVALSY